MQRLNVLHKCPASKATSNCCAPLYGAEEATLNRSAFVRQQFTHYITPQAKVNTFLLEGFAMVTLKNRVAKQIDRMNPPLLNNVLIRVL